MNVPRSGGCAKQMEKQCRGAFEGTGKWEVCSLAVSVWGLWWILLLFRWLPISKICLTVLLRVRLAVTQVNSMISVVELHWCSLLTPKSMKWVFPVNDQLSPIMRFRDQISFPLLGPWHTPHPLIDGRRKTRGRITLVFTPLTQKWPVLLSLALIGEN